LNPVADCRILVRGEFVGFSSQSRLFPADDGSRSFMSDAQPSDQDLPGGTQVGEYVIERKLGEGGMGSVYAGVQPLIGKQVAIKVVAAMWARNEQVTKRFLEEARAVNQIRHPHIIDIFSFGILPDGRPYFVMEFLQGESLEDALETGHITGREVVLLMHQLCDALGAAHAAGFVHRDLKPENLWIARLPNQEPSLKILDFGIAKNLSVPNAKMTVDGQILGTAQYMAPEQAMATTVDGRTDVYALGVILYRILTGALPFEGETAYAVVTKHVTEPPVPLSRLRPIQPALEAVVLDCLAKNPAQRPQSVGDLWARLEPELEDWAGPPVVSPRRVASTGAARPVLSATSARTTPLAATTSRASIPPVAGVTRVQAPSKASGGRTAVVVGVVVVVLAVVGVGIYLGRGSSPAPASLAGSAVLDTRPRALAAVPVPSATVVPPLAPAARPPEAQVAVHDAGPVAAPAANPALAPSSEPAKKHHRERRNPEGGEPLPL
jgi:serine/threonine-protein kinase